MKKVKDLEKELNDLQNQKETIEYQIVGKKKEIAKSKGLVVDSIGELVCKEHSKAIFKVTGTIPESFFYAAIHNKDKNGLNIYECEECNSDTKTFEKSKAYDCPRCGIVLGDFVRKHYRSSKESWLALAGREGEHYHCKICDMQLGSHYWRMS